MIDDHKNDFDAFRNTYEADKITLLNQGAIWKNRDVLDGKTLVLKGKFINDYNYDIGERVDLQACSTKALIIDEDHFRRDFR